MAPKNLHASADRLARTVLRDRLGLRPKENVTIECYPTSLPWASGFVREARRAGAFPLIHYEDERSYWDGVQDGKTKAVGSLPEHERAILEETDVYVFFWGPEDLGRVRALPDKVQDTLFAFNMDWYKAAQKAGVRGARMAVARATEENARTFGVDRADWEEQLVAASSRNPAAFAPTVRVLEKGLGGRGEAHLTHPNGTDLTLALGDFPIQKDLGVLPPKKEWGLFNRMINVPPGSVYVALDASTADGTLVANRTSTTNGLLKGGHWTFEDGRLTEYDYAEGGDAFARRFKAATGRKDRPSFLEVGINPDLHGGPLLEENELGAVTVGVGNNTGFGGKNKSSIFDFLTLAGATLTIRGRPLVKGGKVVG